LFWCLGEQNLYVTTIFNLFSKPKTVGDALYGVSNKNGKIIDTMPVLQRWRGQQQYTDEYTVCRLENS
jgi:hypothetical protein